MACRRHRRDCSRSRSLHGQAHRASFFRGGGLAGRPRAPKDWPQWGRPSGARLRRKEREGARYNNQDNNDRFEELNTNTDDSDADVDLDRNFRGDELHFTGADLGRLSKRKEYIYHSDSDRSDSGDESDLTENLHNTQLALRDKEEMLVETAMSRIKRAQELGKRNVKLSQPELNALKRKQQKDAELQAQAKRKERRRSSQLKPKKPQGKERVQEQRIEVPIAQYGFDSNPRRPPGMLITASSGEQSYAPLGYQPPIAISQLRSSRPGSRNTSSQSLLKQSPELPRRGERRASKPPSPRSPDSSSRSLPDDPNWMPRPRSSSALTGAPYYPESNYPYPYQAHTPRIPAQYGSASRGIASSPQTSSRDRLPRYDGLGTREASPRRHRRLSPNDPSSSSDDSSDAGVRVNVPYDGRNMDHRSVSEGTSKDRRGGRR